MGGFRKVFFALALLLSLFWGITIHNTAIAEEQKIGSISFRWAFGAVVGPTHERKLISITRDTVLKTGDILQMFVELQKPGFVYILYHGSQGEIYLLFPHNLNTKCWTFQKYYIPEKDIGMELDDQTGLEKFYLFVSPKRLNDLESLYQAYASAADHDKEQIAQQIIVRIKELKRKHRRLSAEAERPVPLGGSVRGLTKDKKEKLPDIELIAVKISADNFYSRTFTIDHQ